MGCASSKIDDLEDVAQCKARKQFIRQAVSSRHAFAAAHAAYVQVLKNMGAALRQFAETELLNPTPPPQPLRPPPPLPPQFLHPPTTLIRSQSLPPGMLQKQPASSAQRSTKTQTLDAVGEQLDCNQEQQEEEEEEEEEAEVEVEEEEEEECSEAAEVTESLADEQQQETQEYQCDECCEGVDDEEDSDFAEDTTVVNEAEVKNKMVTYPNKELAVVLPAPRTGRDLMDAIKQVDDLFLKAYGSGMEVASMLEARKVHYEMNFVDKGFYDPSRKLLNVISWGHLPRKTKTPLASRDGNDETEGPEIQGSHAALLDRIFAWEKKLYNEVKGFEIIRLQYERKSAELRKLESKGIEVGLDEMKATIKFLRLRTMVALQAVDTASTAIARLRDDELYLQLLHLLHVTMNMWHEMYHNHQEQTSILSEMVKLDDLLRAVDQTCNLHMLSTQQLEGVLNEWHKTFKEFIPSQRIYMQNLNGWLRLNLVPLQTASGEKLDHQLTDSPTPPIYKLCQEWHKALEKLPDQIVLEAINSVVEMVHDLVELHLEELHRKKVVQALEQQLDKKVTALENYKRKYFEPTDVAEERQDPVDDPLQERKNVIDELRKRVDDEKAKISKAVQDSRKVTKQIFSSGLPGLFEAFTHFSSICSQMYQGLDKHVTTAGSPSSTDTI